MNGLGLPAAQPSVAELEAQLAMARALEPIQRELADAKRAYRDALDGGDQAVIEAAKERKRKAAHDANETRTWLRREARIAKLRQQLPALVERLAGRILDPDGREDVELRAELQERADGMRQELEALEGEAVPLRELFAAAGPPVIVETPSVTEVELPTATVRARAQKGGK
ncbi:hypothetical protein HII36_29710 [Nonomuraea sp. NN258]|uniref:hypothetical protein n=1 Tax=Nonomuraea antri TaxID=2730852 RepID=UPI0015684428|nr:hypothetical protein [Nonomuraea antri]NRQ35978.1 hypothetical protein [Nonomuraea antri]